MEKKEKQEQTKVETHRSKSKDRENMKDHIDILLNLKLNQFEQKIQLANLDSINPLEIRMDDIMKLPENLPIHGGVEKSSGQTKYRIVKPISQLQEEISELMEGKMNETDKE